mmetsp:Transcript_14347/g.36415  ORF Transcript_14347/g.36415 Transcript_14347/m.36415 type:complete len:349 (+) Transcript_14347:64-1110(+)
MPELRKSVSFTDVLHLAPVIEQLTSAAGRKERGAVELSHGANAVVFALPAGAGTALLPDERRVELSDLVVKCGRWRSRRHFDEEVELSRVAAAAGLGPVLYYASAVPLEHGVVQGIIAMERLTQPTLYRWLHWMTRSERVVNKQPNVGAWTISDEALKLPLVKVWIAECRRLRSALIAAGIAHGDWHERNLIMDVPAARTLTAVGKNPSPLEHHETKSLIMKAIAAGPAAGQARLLVIDYGGAKRLKSKIGRFFAFICIDRHLVDPDEESPSPPSALSRQVSAKSRATFGRVMRTSSRAVDLSARGGSLRSNGSAKPEPSKVGAASLARTSSSSVHQFTSVDIARPTS